MDRYKSFGRDYLEGGTVQGARTAMSEFNVTLGELARTTLPAVNLVLRNFRSILEGIRSVLPGGNGQGEALIGARAAEGAGAGALWGALGGTAAVLGGAVVGGVVGGVGGVIENYLATEQKQHANGNAFGLPPVPQISLSLNLDGTTLARVLSKVGDIRSKARRPHSTAWVHS